MPSGRHETLGEQKLTPQGQVFGSATSSNSGIMCGVRWAWHDRWWKCWNWKHERESASGLALPQTEDAVNINEWHVASKDKWCSNPIKCWSREDTDLSTATHCRTGTQTCWETHWEPYKVVATMMGRAPCTWSITTFAPLPKHSKMTWR